MAKPRELDPDRSGDEATTPPVKMIKRYTNRKLYDTVESRYVTLEEIAEMIRTGEDVRIIDNRSKEDLTSVTLAQIIFEQEKKKARMPLGMLRDLVRTGGDSLQGFIREEIQPRVASFREGAGSLQGRIKQQATDIDPRGPMKDMLDPLMQQVEEWQKRIDERVKSTKQTVSLSGLQADMANLQRRIADLAGKVRTRDGDPSAGSKAADEKSE